jgi:hypothetical protein
LLMSRNVTCENHKDESLQVQRLMPASNRRFGC